MVMELFAQSRHRTLSRLRQVPQVSLTAVEHTHSAHPLTNTTETWNSADKAASPLNTTFSFLVYPRLGKRIFGFHARAIELPYRATASESMEKREIKS